MDDKRRAFMIMPFEEQFEKLYEKLKNEFQGDYEFTNAGDLDGEQGNILNDIVEGIMNADIIIADLTGLNSNVFYELGLAHALNKNVVIITQDIDELPFDIRGFRAHEYDPVFYKIDFLIDVLKDILKGVIDGSVRFNNPISNYKPDYFIKYQFQGNNQSEDKEGKKQERIEVTKKENDEGDLGFLDYMTNINEYSEMMGKEIEQFGEDMELMSGEVDLASSELNRVQQNSGELDPSFARNVCRKLADPVNKFANNSKEHIDSITCNWNAIENNYLLLLDTDLMRELDNKELEESIKSLEEMQIAILESNSKVELFIYSLKSVLGMERRLNKAVKAVIEEMNRYLSTSETMASSVDKIIQKSEAIKNSKEKELKS